MAYYGYDAWGNALSSYTSGIGFLNPLRYRGYVYDQETELYYLQSRYYDPEIGRFINADAFTSTNQGLLSNNMYAYCSNNPVMGYDPTGLINWGGIAVGIGLAILTAVTVAATVATAGAASPLMAAAVTTIGTVASAAIGEAAVVTTVGAYTETPVVYDVTVVNGNNRSGMSMVYDFGNDTADLYLHEGAQTSNEYSVTFGSGFVFNHTERGCYGGEFVDVSQSVSYKGAKIGADFCTSPDNLSRDNFMSAGTSAFMFTSGFGSSSFYNKGPTYAYDYYWYLNGK